MAFKAKKQNLSGMRYIKIFGIVLLLTVIVVFALSYVDKARFSALNSVICQFYTFLSLESKVHPYYFISFIAVVFSACLILFFYFRLLKNKLVLERLAYVDAITGLANWNRFKIDCKEILNQHTPSNYAYISISIDNFEIISDIYNIDKSNSILCIVAEELNKSLNHNEVFARQSNESFGVLLTYTDNNDLTYRLIALNHTVSAIVPDINISLNCGIFEIKDKDVPLDVINDRASLARQTVQSGSGINYAFYNDKLRQRMIKEKQIENHMENALANREFELHFQPKYDFKSEEIVGAEALVRWRLRNGQVLYPQSFIPVFEKNGFIRRLDLYMFESVCKMLRSMIDRNMKVVPISVNISRLHIYDSNFVLSYVSVFKKYNLHPNLIELEMTESVYMDDVNLLNSIISKFHEIGFRLSMDDFGSGYSSLNMLKDSLVDIIKIDKEFLSNMSDSLRNKYIIESVIAMCKKIGLQVVAEGVETKAQAEFLRDLNCDIAQGYYYSKPINMTSFESLLQGSRI